MAVAAPQQQRMPAPVAPDLGRVAAGGVIADMQRELEQRLVSEPPVPLRGNDGGVVHRVSRFAGPALLVATYGAVLLWWF